MRRTSPVAIITALALAASTAFGAPVATAQDDPTFRTILGVGPDNSGVQLSWRSDYEGQEFVRVHPVDAPDQVQEFSGYDVDGGAHMFNSKHAEVTGLTPATKYSYSIGSDAAGWSPAYEFTTDDTDANWNFLAYTDAQIGVDLKVEENGQTWRDTTAVSTANYPDASFLLHLGDQVEGWGDKVAQYAQFLSPDQVREYPTAVLYGNHEDYQLGKHYFDEHYNLPNEQGDSANYYFEHNNVLFIGINSMFSTPEDIARHQQFIRDTVAAHGGDKDWIIAGMHHAPFSQGSHTHDADVEAVREGLTPVFSETGVDLVMSGHDHIYTRSHLMNGTTPQVPEAPAQVGDRIVPTEGETLYVTLTTATGSKYYDFYDQLGNSHADASRSDTLGTGLELPTTAYWQQDYTPDYTNVQISADEITLTTHNTYSDELVDQVTLSKSGTPAPTTPGEQIAPAPEDPRDPATVMANSGSSQDELLDLLDSVLLAADGSIGQYVPYYRRVANALGIRF
ncbi:metallophosphoesterase [Corynebacterium sp. S7]